MDKTNKLYLISSMLIAIWLIGIASAEIQTLGTFKVGSCIELLQTCSNCSYQNITSVLYPNSTKAMGGAPMTKTGSYYNATFCFTSALGQYIVNGIGDVDDVDTVWAYDFFINPLGKNFTNSQAILYFLIFIIAFILFLLCITFGIYMPARNERDAMTGFVIAVQNMKYLKMFLLAVGYLMLVLMVYFGWMISYGYLDLDFLGSLFNFTFYFLLILMAPLFIIGVFVVIANAIRDNKISEALQRGFRIR